MSIVASRVRMLLVDLGETHLKVAAALKKHRIKGERFEGARPAMGIPRNPRPGDMKGSSDSCPIGNYLRAQNIVEPHVNRHFVWFRDPISKRLEKVETTAAVACFVNDFDEGDFPELETP